MNERLKEMFKDKKTSNLVLVVILLTVLLISINVIFKEEEPRKATQVISENVEENTKQDIEQKLSNIISKIKGVESAHVMITYTSTEKIIPVYDTKEDVDTTTENQKVSTKKTTEKTVAYESAGSSKVAIVESRESANATGAIVVVNGSISDTTKNEIKEAVCAVTNVPLYKIQVFINE